MSYFKSRTHTKQRANRTLFLYLLLLALAGGAYYYLYHLEAQPGNDNNKEQSRVTHQHKANHRTHS